MGDAERMTPSLPPNFNHPPSRRFRTRKATTIYASYVPVGEKHPIPTAEQLRPYLREQPAPSDRDVEGPCLVWTKWLDHDGYGMVYYRRVDDDLPMHQRVHRIYYKATKGHVDPSLVLDHLCGVRNCVVHLEPITQAENVRRGDSPFGINHRREVCARGHDAWRERKDGRRYCGVCLKEDSRSLRERRRKALIE